MGSTLLSFWTPPVISSTFIGLLSASKMTTVQHLLHGAVPVTIPAWSLYRTRHVLTLGKGGNLRRDEELATP